MMRTLQSQIRWCARVQWVLGGALAVGLIAFYFIGYSPSTSRLETLRMQIESKQRELAESQNKARNLGILAAEVYDLERKVRIYDRQFPERANIGPFIRDITQIGQQLSLVGWKYQPGAPKRSDNYSELPIIMSFDGEFLNVASFIRQLEDMERLTRVRKLELRGLDVRDGAVRVDMSMNIYYSEG